MDRRRGWDGSVRRLGQTILGLRVLIAVLLFLGLAALVAQPPRPVPSGIGLPNVGPGISPECGAPSAGVAIDCPGSSGWENLTPTYCRSPGSGYVAPSAVRGLSQLRPPNSTCAVAPWEVDLNSSTAVALRGRVEVNGSVLLLEIPDALRCVALGALDGLDFVCGPAPNASEVGTPCVTGDSGPTIDLAGLPCPPVGGDGPGSSTGWQLWILDDLPRSIGLRVDAAIGPSAPPVYHTVAPPPPGRTDPP